jgi:hypothetical protein
MTIRVARITRAEARVWREGIFSLSFCAAMYFDLIHGFDRVLALCRLMTCEIHSKTYQKQNPVACPRSARPRAGRTQLRLRSVVSPPDTVRAVRA